MQSLRVPEDFLILAVVVGSVAVLPAPTAASAQHPAPSSVEIVVDGSGSMRGRLGALDKMAVARRLLTALRAELEAGGTSPALSLRAFGTQSDRGERNCSDTERLVGPGDSLSSWDAALATLEPRGVSPLAAALEAAEADGAEAYVVVTDGVDNCARDACATWRELATPSGSRPHLHVVALDPNPADLEPLRCLSRVGSGAFIRIDDPDRVTDVARRLALLLRNESVIEVRTAVGSTSFRAPIELVRPLTREPVIRGSSGEPIVVPAGMYSVVVRATPEVSSERHLLLPGETTVIEHTDFGRLTVELLDFDNTRRRAPVSISATGERDELRFATTGDSLVLGAGRYDIRVDTGDAFAVRRGLVIRAGEITRVAIGGSGTVRIVAANATGVSAAVRLFGENGVDSLTVGDSLRVAAGRYRATVGSVPPYVAEGVLVEPERETVVEMPETGRLSLYVFGIDGESTGVEADVVSPATDEIVGTLRSGEIRLAMPGRYRLELRTIPAQSLGEVEVEPGREIRVERRGLSKIELGSSFAGAGIDYRLEVFDAEDRTLATESGRAPFVRVWPGEYRARVWRDDALIWDGRVSVAANRAARIDSNSPTQGESE